MRALPDLAVFTTAEAAGAGWTASALRNAVRNGRLRRVRRGVYTADRAGDRAVIAAIAAARSHPLSVVSHRSALALHGLPLLGPAPALPTVTVRPRSNASMAGIHPHRASLRRCDVTHVGDTPVTSVARSVVDAARHSSLLAGVAAMDAAVHRDLCSQRQIADVLRWCWNWPRIARAQRAADLVDARSESPLESVSRVVIGWLGLPVPQTQVTVFDAAGRFVARTDFYWDEYGVFGEADGRGKYDARSVLVAEKDRQEALEDLGLVGARWGWDIAVRRHDDLRSRLQHAFDRGNRRDRSGFPRLWTL